MGVAIGGSDPAAKAAADAAMQLAQNARQMVLNRDTTTAALGSDVDALKSTQQVLSDLAAAYQSALAASTQDRADLHAQVDALKSTIAALPNIRTGTAVVTAALLAGATRDVAVTLNPAMPDANYAAGAWITGGTALLGQTQLVGITGKTATTVTVQIKNIGLTVLAASAVTVQVIATK